MLLGGHCLARCTPHAEADTYCLEVVKIYTLTWILADTILDTSCSEKDNCTKKKVCVVNETL